MLHSPSQSQMAFPLATCHAHQLLPHSQHLHPHMLCHLIGCHQFGPNKLQHNLTTLHLLPNEMVPNCYMLATLVKDRGLSNLHR